MEDQLGNFGELERIGSAISANAVAFETAVHTVCHANEDANSPALHVQSSQVWRAVLCNLVM